MKEVISFAGRGFLAVTIAAGMLLVLGLVGESRNISDSIEADESMYYYEMDIAYMDSKAEDDLTVQWIFDGYVTKQMHINPKDFFLATDKEGKSEEVEILSIEGDESGKSVFYEDGKYSFSASGIYKMYIKCRNAVYVVRFPVNVVEG